MRKQFLILEVVCVILVGSALFLLNPSSVAAKMSSDAGASTNSVTVIVLDMSGSMNQNDPNGYRCSAANAFIQLSGPGDFIGVIGLDNNNGVTAGSHNFEVAQNWSDPVEMSTVRAKNDLINTIHQQSNDCKPDNTTPTYDSLSKALNMLESSAKNGISKGQVILLTDGAPFPRAQDQITDIQNELIPQFQKNNWQINTVALGADATDNGIDYHSFLAGLARSTSGGYYDDSNGPVKGVSSLNITPFFIDIYDHFHNRVLTPDISYTTLSSQPFQRNFSVIDFVQHLDVLIVKDDSSVSTTLRNQSGQIVSGNSAGVSSISDKYFQIFSVDNPLAGQWELDLTGNSGSHFLVYDLTTSNLGAKVASVNVNDPNTNQTFIGASGALPLGSTVSVTAMLTSNGQNVSSSNFKLVGQITYKGEKGFFQQPFELASQPGGAYLGTVNVPLTAPVGSYGVTVDVQESGTIPLAQSAEFPVRIALFPTYYFIHCTTFSGVSTCEPTPDVVNAAVTKWDSALHWIYSLPLVGMLGKWAINGSAQATVVIPGQVKIGDTNTVATVYGYAIKAHSSKQIPVTITYLKDGAFQASFLYQGNGAYAVTLYMRGNLQSTTGDLSVASRTVNVSVIYATANDEWIAWLKTGIYVLLLTIIGFMFNFFLRPIPQVSYAIVTNDGIRHDLQTRIYRNKPAHIIRWIFKRNFLSSDQLNMGPFLMLQFRRGTDKRQIIWARQSKKAPIDWKIQNGPMNPQAGKNSQKTIIQRAKDWFLRIIEHKPNPRYWRRIGYNGNLTYTVTYDVGTNPKR